MPVPVPRPVVSVSRRTSGWAGSTGSGSSRQAVQVAPQMASRALDDDDGPASRGSMHHAADVRRQALLPGPSGTRVQDRSPAGTAARGTRSSMRLRAPPAAGPGGVAGCAPTCQSVHVAQAGPRLCQLGRHAALLDRRPVPRPQRRGQDAQQPRGQRAAIEPALAAGADAGRTADLAVAACRPGPGRPSTSSSVRSNSADRQADAAGHGLPEVDDRALGMRRLDLGDHAQVVRVGHEQDAGHRLERAPGADEGGIELVAAPAAHGAGSSASHQAVVCSSISGRWMWPQPTFSCVSSLSFLKMVAMRADHHLAVMAARRRSGPRCRRPRAA